MLKRGRYPIGFGEGIEMTTNFWKNIPSNKDFNAFFNIDAYTPFDRDWDLFIADIKGSTKAINEGRYKDVNMVGAMSIVAVINACPTIEILFVFGGDGASILVPHSHFEQAKLALLGTKQRSENNFNLYLRIGAISVQDLAAKGIDLLVAKHEISKDYQQAIFFGGGISQADALFKADSKYCFDSYENLPEVDFSGLECRWQDIPSPKGETLSLLVAADDAIEYTHLLKYITENIGSYQERNPVQQTSMKLSFSFSQLGHEATVKAKGFKRCIFTQKLWLINMIGLIFMKFNIKTNHTSWGEYKKQVSQTTDAEKFDDILRMTFTAASKNRKQLESYLKKAQQEGRLCW